MDSEPDRRSSRATKADPIHSAMAEAMRRPGPTAPVTACGQLSVTCPPRHQNRVLMPASSAFNHALSIACSCAAPAVSAHSTAAIMRYRSWRILAVVLTVVSLALCSHGSPLPTLASSRAISPRLDVVCPTPAVLSADVIRWNGDVYFKQTAAPQQLSLHEDGAVQVAEAEVQRGEWRQYSLMQAENSDDEKAEKKASKAEEKQHKKAAKNPDVSCSSSSHCLAAIPCHRRARTHRLSFCWLLSP